jgi:hypothetical protein
MERLVLKFRFGHIDPGGGRGAQDQTRTALRILPGCPHKYHVW